MASTQTAWWRSAAIYSVYVRSCEERNEDGSGHLLGVKSGRSYLKKLGVDAIWTTPWSPSPMPDGGYDFADYRDVDPTLATLAIAEQLIDDTYWHKLRVILGIVPNQTSNRHPWFRAAHDVGPSSPEQRRYIFRDGRGPGGDQAPNNWPSHGGGPAWTRITEPDGQPGQWCLPSFTPAQPDLNWDEPCVQDEFESIVRGDELHTAFNSDYLFTIRDSGALRAIIERSLEELTEVGAPATWVLSNHDIVCAVPGFGRSVSHLRDRRRLGASRPAWVAWLGTPRLWSTGPLSPLSTERRGRGAGLIHPMHAWERRPFVCCRRKFPRPRASMCSRLCGTRMC